MGGAGHATLKRLQRACTRHSQSTAQIAPVYVSCRYLLRPRASRQWRGGWLGRLSRIRRGPGRRPACPQWQRFGSARRPAPPPTAFGAALNQLLTTSQPLLAAARILKPRPRGRCAGRHAGATPRPKMWAPRSRSWKTARWTASCHFNQTSATGQGLDHSARDILKLDSRGYTFKTAHWPTLYTDWDNTSSLDHPRATRPPSPPNRARGSHGPPTTSLHPPTPPITRAHMPRPIVRQPDSQ